MDFETLKAKYGSHEAAAKALHVDPRDYRRWRTKRISNPRQAKMIHLYIKDEIGVDIPISAILSSNRDARIKPGT